MGSQPEILPPSAGITCFRYHRYAASEQGGGWGRKLEDHDLSPWPHHPRHLSDAAFEILQIAQSERNGSRIEARVRPRQRKGVAEDELDAIREPGPRHFFAPAHKHLADEVEAAHPAVPAGPRKRQCKVGGAGGDVGDAASRRQVRHAHQARPPCSDQY